MISRAIPIAPIVGPPNEIFPTTVLGIEIIDYHPVTAVTITLIILKFPSGENPMERPIPKQIIVLLKISYNFLFQIFYRCLLDKLN